MLLSETIDADSVGIPVACAASSLPCNLDRRPGSCLMVDGHWRSWPDFLAKSLVCFEYSRRLWRSHPLSGGLSLPLLLPFLLPAVPQRRRAPLPAAVSRRAAR